MILWGIILAGTGIFAWVSGERIMFLAFGVMLIWPVVSYSLTLFMLRGLRLYQQLPADVLKNEEGFISLRLHNVSPLPFGNVNIIVSGDEHALKVSDFRGIFLRPFKRTELKIPFQALYRGHYKLGVLAVQVPDMTGLFRLNRKFEWLDDITVLPLVADVSGFPLTMNLMTQAHSHYDIRDEDYSTISDIRPYLPSDSIKRVHWKLTAKRNEWLVKIFESNALNQVKIIMDSSRLGLGPEDVCVLEDHMVETALGVGKYCLKRGMPVDFIPTDGRKAEARGLAEFEHIYQLGSGLRFESPPPLDCTTVLAHVLNDASGYVNAVIITACLDAALYERVIKGQNNGHYIAIVFFPTLDLDSEKVYRLMTEGGVPCYRLDRRVA